MLPRILYNNLLLTATLSSSTVASGYSVQNILDQKPYTFWKANAAGTNYIQGTWGSAQSINSVAFCAHNFYTVDATVYIEHSDDNSNWTSSGAYGGFTANNVLMCFFTPVSARYWRIRIINSTGAPQIGVLFFGLYLEMEYPPDSPVTPFEKTIKAQVAKSETGNLLGAVVKNHPITINHTWIDITKTWADANWTPFMLYAEEMNSFFYAWDGYNSSADMFYCRLKEDFNNNQPVSRLLAYDRLTLTADARK